jgi:hypothetical protein
MAGKMKILIPLTGQLSGGNVQPEVFMGQSDSFPLAESRRMLYNGGHGTDSLYALMKYVCAF